MGSRFGESDCGDQCVVLSWIWGLCCVVKRFVLCLEGWTECLLLVFVTKNNMYVNKIHNKHINTYLHTNSHLDRDNIGTFL